MVPLLAVPILLFVFGLALDAIIEHFLSSLRHADWVNLALRPLVKIFHAILVALLALVVFLVRFRGVSIVRSPVCIML